MPHSVVNCLSSTLCKFSMKISFLQPFNLYHPLPLPAWLTFTAWCLVSSAGSWELGDLVSIADVTIFGKSLHLFYCIHLITVIIFNWAVWRDSIITAVTPNTTRLELFSGNTAIQDCELLGSTSNLKYLADTVAELNVTSSRSFFHPVSSVDKQNICSLHWNNCASPITLQKQRGIGGSFGPFFDHYCLFHGPDPKSGAVVWGLFLFFVPFLSSKAFS